MGADPRGIGPNDESGQGLIELLIVLPFLVGITLVLIRVSTVIQMSIVNQKYARMQTMMIAYNNAFYPRIELRGLLEDQYVQQMTIGVSENDAGANSTPEASVYKIVRPGEGLNGAPRELGNDDPGTPDLRQGRGRIRVRGTVAMCTPPQLVNDNGRPRFVYCRDFVRGGSP